MKSKKPNVFVYGFLPNYPKYILSGSDSRFLNIFYYLQTRLNLHFWGTENFKSRIDSFSIKNRIFIRTSCPFTYTNQIDFSFYSFLLFVFSIPRLIFYKYPINSYHYATSDLPWDILPCLLAKKFHKNQLWIQCVHHLYPHWSTRHGNKLISFCGYHIQQFSLSIAKHNADTIIAVNPKLKNSLEKIGFKSNLIFINQNGIRKPSKISGKSNKNQVIYLGRLSKSKGIDQLLESWSYVTKQIPKSRLYLAGHYLDSDFKKYQQKTKELNISKKVVFTGYVSESQKHKLLSQSSLFISLSNEEGFGITILEAMSHWLPVILKPLDNYYPIYGKCPVYIKKEDSAQKIADKIVDILKNPQINKQKYQNLLNKYSWQSISKNELKIIKNTA